MPKVLLMLSIGCSIIKDLFPMTNLKRTIINDNIESLQCIVCAAQETPYYIVCVTISSIWL